jgi:DNA-binding beta-propeller fold protein YncE
VVDALFDAVQIFDRDGQYLLGFGATGQEKGRFWLPGGLFIDENDTIYVADAYNRRVQVFKHITSESDG